MGKTQSLRSLLAQTMLPPNEARILLAHVLEKHYQLPRSALLSRDDMQIHSDAQIQWEDLQSRRLRGEPIAYLVGKKGFHEIELFVAPGVLIPRPETELLVEIALKEISQLNQEVRILDLGTGSGAIALAIAHSAPHVKVTATDQSPDALAIAKKNAALLKLESRVQFKQGSWYESLSDDAPFDIILSNPPYIAHQDSHLERGDLRFETISALTDHAGGLSCLEEIIANAPRHLKNDGLIAVEHGFDQSEAVISLIKTAGFSDIQKHLDLSGHDRVVSARK
ncbi:peptide chain release factor N(5)-glutamine methyltransferase [Polynucleobacter necessarius]|uniref:peptide chain release factor N(5)-glutamine methyltransferase n=1 Tax=Polynucleobacter necessarius TaxID=576610 RepID=UPI000E09839F|nr:peptide chain release factor N(5)-glutamine methyltransferase [Polynucleobacter necessarius]